MDDSNYSASNEKISVRIYHFLEKIWPSIYKAINDFFYGFINFIKFIISGLWPGK